MFAQKQQNKILMMGIAMLCLFLSSCHYSDPLVSDEHQIQMAAADQAVPLNLSESLNMSDGCGIDPTGTYYLGKEDVLDIIVFEEDNLSGRYTVQETGSISMPLIGQVDLNGCSVQEAEQKIAAKYADGYLVNPSISIQIKSYRPFYIIGEVRSPGRYDYASDMSALKAVALAGGFTYRANRKTVKILRNTRSGKEVHEKETITADIKPGDIIFIKERLF